MSGRVALVTGATGAIGPALVNLLIASDYDVRTYSLDSPQPGLFASSATCMTGDINDTNAVAQALDGVDAVFHLAALLHIENPGPDLISRYRLINVNGSRAVAEQVLKAGVRRMIYFSTVKVYGVHQRDPVTEHHPTNPKTIYAQTKLEGEQAIRSVRELDATVLRLSAVYGPRLKGSWGRLIESVKGGRFLPVGNMRNVHSLTYVDDVARAAVLVAEREEAVGRTYNVVGHETPTLRDILEAIYYAIGKRVPPVAAPSWLALAGAFAAEKGLQLIGARSPITRESIRQLIADEAYCGAALRQIGFTSRVTLLEGWSKTIAQSGNYN